MMHLNEEQLKALEEMAYLLIPLKMIALNFEVSIMDLKLELREENSPVYQAYYKGLLRQKMELHQSIVKAAHNGSNPAQEQLLRIMELERENNSYLM